MLVSWATNISFLTEKLPYSKICGTKVGTSYKKTASLTNFYVSKFATMLAAEESSIDQMSAEHLANMTEYADRQFLVPVLKATNRMYKMQESLHEHRECGPQAIFFWKVQKFLEILVISENFRQVGSLGDRLQRGRVYF